ADIESTAEEAVACLGAQAFALRCSSADDVLGTRHFRMAAPLPPPPLPPVLPSPTSSPGAGGAGSDQVADRLALLLPVVANAVTSKLGLGPGPFQMPDVERELLAALLRSITDEQMRAIALALRVDQLIALTALRDRLTGARPDPRETS